MLVYLAILLAAPTVRAAPAATDLPTGWHLLEACAVDGADRVIQSSKWTRSWNNTAANCIAKCNTQGYAFAGLEYGVECHCGKGISADIVSAPVSECSTLCPGDNTQTCGAGWRISLYAKDVNTMPVYSLPTGWSTLMECAYDSAARLFTDTQVNYLTTNTPSVCASHCADGGYAYSGVEYGRECYCGNTLATSLVARPDSDCYMDCAGDATQNCGGNWAVQLYSNPSLVASRSASASASASTTSTSGSPTSSSVAFPSDWSVLHACSVDNGNRILPQTNTLNDNTPARCAQLCYSRGYKVSGTEYGRECYCGDSFSFPPVDRPASECSFACTGDATQKCGAGWRIQLVGDSSLGSSTTTSTSAGPSATADPLGLPSGWQTAYRCAIDDASRILGQFNTLSNNSPSNCAEVCSDKGYHIAAVEYGGECMCGDSFNFAPVLAPTSECYMPCSGANDLTCGAGWRTQIYTNNAALVPANNEFTSSSSSSSSTSTSSSSSSTTSSSTSSSTSTTSTTTTSSTSTTGTTSSTTTASPTSTTATGTTTSTSASATASCDDSKGRITQWSQCGGQNWSQSTCCVDGYYCQWEGQYLSQCIPNSQRSQYEAQYGTGPSSTASTPTTQSTSTTSTGTSTNASTTPTTTTTSTSTSTSTSTASSTSSSSSSSTTTTTTTTTTTSAAATTTASCDDSKGRITQWSQCGGQNWSQSTCCVDGYYCQWEGQYLSQCIPNSQRAQYEAQYGTGPTTSSTTASATSTTTSSSSSTSHSTTTSTTTSTAASSTATCSNSSSAVAQYGQCAGTGWNNNIALQCKCPYTCKFNNAYYSQCL